MGPHAAAMSVHAVAVILAAGGANDPAASIVTAILQYGLLGLLLLDVALTHRLFVPRWAYDAMQEERRRERELLEKRITDLLTDNNKLTDLAVQQVIPALTRSTEVNKDYLVLLQERQRDYKQR